MSFVESISWGFKTIVDAPQGSLMCGASVMGDPHPGHKMQCFCEPHLPSDPKWCASEGQDCKCKGNVFFGQKSNDHNTNLTFIEMIHEPYGVKRLGKTQGSMNCSNKAMGSDPLPGFDKHCFCDGDLVYP